MKEHPVDVEVQLLLKRTPENHLEILINHRSFLMFKEKLLPSFYFIPNFTLLFSHKNKTNIIQLNDVMLLFFYQSESSNLSNVKNIGVSAQATFPYLQKTDINTRHLSKK